MNTKTTKRALLSSAVALLICFAMLLGTTFAWFTDSATSGCTVVQSGKLDIVLEYWDGDSWENAEGHSLGFIKGGNYNGVVGSVLWEPGCTYELPKIRVRNEGNLTAKVVLRINGVTGDEKLLEAITFTTKVANVPDSLKTGSAGSQFAAMEGASYAWFYGTPDGTVMMDWTLSPKGETTLNTGHTDTSAEFTISGHMKEEAGNEYQDLKIDSVSITALATQTVYEYDSFGREYDKDATLPTVWDGSVGTLPTESNGVISISDAAEFAAFANDVNVNGKNYSGKTVVLTNNIDLNNIAWTPIGQTGATEFKGTFDGQGYTIKNLNVDSSAQTGEHYSSGLFGWVEGKVTIKNVNIDGATVKGHHNVAALLGYTYSAQVSNCHIYNATIVCTHANGDACGDKAGAIAGYAGDESRFTNCSASDSTITAGRDAGQILGTGYNVSVSNCTATNVTVTATGDCNREGNINNAIIGRIMG